jgi:chromosome partitioning protein
VKTITFSIRKGGAGKSANCSLLAYCASAQGLRVLVVDLDGQGTVGSTLSGSKTHSPRNRSAKLFGTADQLPKPKSVNVAGGGIIDLLFGERVGLEKIDKQNPFSKQALAKHLRRFSEDYDLCIIDPPSYGRRLESALVASDYVVVPVLPSVECLEGLGDLLETIEGVKKRSNPLLQLAGIVINLVESGNKQHDYIERVVRETYGKLVFDGVINKSAAIASALSDGQSPWGSGGVAVKGLTFYTDLLAMMQLNIKNGGEL